MKEKVFASYKNDFSRFLALEDTNWDAIKAEYEKSESSHKPIENGKLVTKEELPSWCAKAIDSPFDEKDAITLNIVLKWCYLNTNSFEQQAQELNKVLHGDKTGGEATSWQNAWENVYI